MFKALDICCEMYVPGCLTCFLCALPSSNPNPQTVAKSVCLSAVSAHLQPHSFPCAPPRPGIGLLHLIVFLGTLLIPGDPFWLVGMELASVSWKALGSSIKRLKSLRLYPQEVIMNIRFFCKTVLF